MADCSVKLKITLDVYQTLKDLDEQYGTNVAGYWNKLLQALSLLDESLPFLTSETIQQIIRESAGDFKSAATWAVLGTLRAGGEALQTAIVARALLKLSEDLKERSYIAYEIAVMLNAVATCIRIITAEADRVGPNSDIYARVRAAQTYLKRALIASRQLISTWENANIYSDRLYQQVLQNLEFAARELSEVDRTEYRNSTNDSFRQLLGLDDEENFDDLAIDQVSIDSLTIPINEALGLAAGYPYNTSQASGRIAVAMVPLFNMLNTFSESNTARIMAAFSVAISAIQEISRLLPLGLDGYANTLTSTLGPGINIGEVGLKNGLFSNVPEPASNLLISNGKVLNKIRALKSIDLKIKAFNSLVNTVVKYLEECNEDLTTLYADIKAQNQPSIDQQILINRASIWSDSIEDLLYRYTSVVNRVSGTASEISIFTTLFNDVIEEIEAYNVDEDYGFGTFAAILRSFGALIGSLDGGPTTTQTLTKITILTNNILDGYDTDLRIADKIDALNLEQYPDIEIVDDLIDFADRTFPILGQLIASGDIGKINQAIRANTEDANLDALADGSGINLVKDITESIAFQVWDEAQKEIASCISSFLKGSSINVALDSIEFTKYLNLSGDDDEVQDDIQMSQDYYDWKKRNLEKFKL